MAGTIASTQAIISILFAKRASSVTFESPLSSYQRGGIWSSFSHPFSLHLALPKCDRFSRISSSPFVARISQYEVLLSMYGMQQIDHGIAFDSSLIGITRSWLLCIIAALPAIDLACDFRASQIFSRSDAIVLLILLLEPATPSLNKQPRRGGRGCLSRQCLIELSYRH